MLQVCFKLATFLGLLFLLIRAFRHFDRLVQIEYHRYRQQWLEDGAPRGIFWEPPDVSGPGSTLARNRLSLTWVVKSPLWLKNDFEAWYNLKRLRFYCIAWNLGIIAWFFTFVSLS
jgi:hypothetical protein